MAVQAQYLSNAFTPDIRIRIQTDNLLDDLQVLQPQHQINAVVVNNPPFIFNDTAAAFSNPQSELTCNLSGSKKRHRDDSSTVRMANQQYQQAPIRYNNYYYPDVADSVQYPVVDQNPIIETSTSGRVSSSPIGQDLMAQLYNQSLEVDNLIRLQNERLRLGLEETTKRHCRSLIAVLEQQVVRKLKEKELELENVSRKNLELEEKIRQMSAENQIWFNVAKNNEAIVSSLKTSLEHVLLQNAINCNNAVAADQVKEGYGDSDGTPFNADDAQSCCFEGGVEEKTNGGCSGVNGEVKKTVTAVRGCKVCGEKDVSVLLLPCRHLCLCNDCASKVDTCPICSETNKACLQIYVS